MSLVIDLSEPIENRLRELAMEGGYPTAEAFVTEHLAALARQEAPIDPARMTPEELQASLAMIDRSMTEIDSGRSMSVEEARSKTLDSLKEHRG